MGSLAVSAHDASSLLHPTMLAGGSHQVEHTTTTTTPFYPPTPSHTSHRSSTYNQNTSQARTPTRNSEPTSAEPTRSNTSTNAPSCEIEPSQTLRASDPPPQQPSSSLTGAASPPHNSPRSTQRAGAPSIVSSASSSADQSPASPRPVESAATSGSRSPPRIRVRNLQHIQSFVDDENAPLGSENTGSTPLSKASQLPQYEISDMPVADVIEMVAGLLSKIIATNDQQAEHLHRNIHSMDAAAGLSVQTSSVLAFHGKNVPTISIMSYLSRIHKYCPTTYEVFLSLLVYFDRITEKVNATPMESLRQASSEEGSSTEQSQSHSPTSPETADIRTTRPSSSHAAAQSRRTQRTSSTTPDAQRTPSPPSPAAADPLSLAHFFVVDSYNIHRLVIAGVTCASKFFSDIFYTNSRYAKVSDAPPTFSKGVLLPQF